MEAMTTGIVPTMDYSRIHDNYGYGCCDGFGSWWIIIILFAFMNNGLWGNRGNNLATDEFVSNQFTQRDIFNTNTDVLTSASATQREICQVQRDILDSKYDLGTNILENRYTNQLGVQQIIGSQKDCCCETNRNIDSVRYDALLTAKDAQMQLADCCCKLEASGLANTQKILDKLCENEINHLRTDLQSAQLQISQLSQTANITNVLRPYPQPAYITCSPYESAMVGRYGFYGNNCGNCGCNNLI